MSMMALARTAAMVTLFDSSSPLFWSDIKWGNLTGGGGESLPAVHAHEQVLNRVLLCRTALGLSSHVVIHFHEVRLARSDDLQMRL